MTKQRIKAEEVAHRAAKNAEKAALRAEMVARDGQRIVDRSRIDQELRFAKTQQIAVATAGMTLFGAILGIGHLCSNLSTLGKGAREQSAPRLWRWSE